MNHWVDSPAPAGSSSPPHFLLLFLTFPSCSPSLLPFFPSPYFSCWSPLPFSCLPQLLHLLPLCCRAGWCTGHLTLPSLTSPFTEGQVMFLLAPSTESLSCLQIWQSWGVTWQDPWRTMPPVTLLLVSEPVLTGQFLLRSVSYKMSFVFSPVSCVTLFLKKKMLPSDWRCRTTLTNSCWWTTEETAWWRVAQSGKASVSSLDLKIFLSSESRTIAKNTICLEPKKPTGWQVDEDAKRAGWNLSNQLQTISVYIPVVL